MAKIPPPFDTAEEEALTVVATRAGAAAAVAGPSLRVVHAADKALEGRVFPLAEQTIIGRGSDATIVVQDEGVSRHHVRITRCDGGFQLVDLDSRNGTWVNGAPTSETDLKSGDLVEIGRVTVLEFVSGTMQAKLRDALGAARMATWEFNPRTLLIEFGEKADAHLGIPWGAVGGRQRALSSLIHPDDVKRVSAALTEAAASGVALQLEFRLHPPHGQRWLSCKGNQVVRGADTYLAGTATDVTERRVAEDELRRHALIFESLPDATFVTTFSGQVLEANPAAAHLFGLDRPSAMSRDLLELLRAPQRVRVGEIAQAVRSEGRYFTELELEASNGAPRVCQVSVVALRRDPVETVGLLWTLRDISEHKQILRQLGMAERLAAMGTLSAGVAHEINNPLSFVVANLSYLQDELASLAPLEDPAKQELGLVIAESLEGARRITSIVKDLKAFAREGGTTGDPVAVDVGRAVELAHKLALHTLRHRAHVTLSVEKVPPVLGHEHRITQVVLNLLLNAGHAMPENRTGSINVRVFSPRQGQTAIEVADTGTGISPEVLPHIFDPFFTTKPMGVGTGLGLSIVHGIVTSLGGHVDVESSLGRGSRFTVTLPALMLTTEPQVTTELPVVARPVSGARVLIVDDEPLVVSSLSRHLRGHLVVGSQSARHALELLEKDSFDVVLCDLLMPDMTGMELHELLSVREPGLANRFVFMTGGAITERAANFVADVKAPVLRKPVDLEVLRRTIAEVAARRARS